ncbi:hypothetical protein BU24DRAFT_470471 [Aaosphaeria arxii CBS 175.79]|uniref:CCHC-type domain-containing protein n=1 Tax=Aaosphaeria arxii CBS 175.79 TaxID=1450172 RepID=A0A6A5Y7X9_9PLEO|nr:uncharacterized protein BU24DRAFT_470471 [Aaosphaeria arxii CBS 175.79]KAF2021685.1 hypothetical protein BU24DRAFT_470471 [Aaosphaeria arxii CBS 175.79]
MSWNKNTTTMDLLSLIDTSAASWKGEETTDPSNADNGGGAHDSGENGGSTDDTGGFGGGGGADGACRICHQEGHFARECPEKPAGGGLTGECFNCGEVGHNKADCTNAKVEREFTGNCNECGEQGHQARNCPTKPPVACRLCGQEGHKALHCTSRRIIDYNGVPELTEQDAWASVVNSCKDNDMDIFRLALRAYARALDDKFDLATVENALREEKYPFYLIARKQEIAITNTIVDLIGNPDREFVLTIQTSAKPRRKMMREGWPATPEENLVRLASAGFVEGRGVPLCGNCGGHFGKECPNVEKRTCRNCHSEDHMAKDCDQPPNPDNVTCRNCEKLGHFARQCPEAKDWSKVKCTNCGEMGHTIRRCKVSVQDDAGAQDDAGTSGGAPATGSGDTAAGAWDTQGAVESSAAAGEWSGKDAGNPDADAAGCIW